MGFFKPCAVEAHPQKNEIVRMLSSGMSARTISAQVVPPIRHNAIDYYRRKYIPYNSSNSTKVEERQRNLSDINNAKIERVVEAAAKMADSGDFASLEYHRRRILSRLEGLDARRSTWLIEAQADRHWTACAQLDGINIRSLELQARLLGLDQAPVTGGNSMVISFTSGSVSISASSHNPPQLEAGDAVETIDITPDE